MKTDIIFLHAPSVYDFREKSIMYGPVSDLVPSTPIFEMYPLGFPIMADYLEKFGFKTRIVNIALRMLENPLFDAEKFISSLNPAAFGIDLHWLPHAHGSIEIARIVKKYHPDTPVIFGGFSSTYFHKELIGYPWVDYVIKGDSTEEPLRMLMEMLRGNGTPDEIPNLTWKDKDGTVFINEISYLPANMSHVNLDYSFVMKLVFRYRDLLGHVPFLNWLNYPIVAALTCRGCKFNCATCGGSAYTFRNTYGRKQPAFRSPERLAEDILNMQKYIKGPVFVLGDLLQPGEDYGYEVIDILKKNGLKNKLALEFFSPPPKDFINELKGLKVKWSVEISVESHEEELRKKFGKQPYTNPQLMDFVKDSLEAGCERFDLYFMTGIPFQTKESILNTADFCRDLYEYVPRKKDLLVFTSPLAPFLDPGSLAYENPKKYGYTITCNTLEEHRQALLKPSWKYIMNYESDYITRDELVEATYEAAIGLNKVKMEAGAVDKITGQNIQERVIRARAVMRKVDSYYMKNSPDSEDERMRKLKRAMGKYNVSTVCEKSELEWKTSLLFKFKVHRILPMLLKGK